MSLGDYHFGVPSQVIWSSHLLMGAFFVYVGYAILTKKPLSVAVALILVVLGALGALYHAHLWWLAQTKLSKRGDPDS